jgi:hypothetical protein
MRTSATLALSLVLSAAALPSSAITGQDFQSLARRLSYEHPELPRAAVHRLFYFLKTHYAPNTRYAAIIDFDKPSDEKRLYLIHLQTGAVERYLVAHGQGSGDRYAREFSDQPRSHESSLGLYLTGEEYQGKHGRSLKLHGMEASNNMAESRAVVIHGADYVTDAAARDGSIGRSWGCPAVDFKHLDRIIDALRGGAALLAYRS